MQPSLFSHSPRFDGAVYEPAHDQARLSRQIDRIYALVSDGRWRTLREIADVTGDSEASISAQLRNLKKSKFGSHVIEKRARGDRSHGCWEYRIAC